MTQQERDEVLGRARQAGEAMHPDERRVVVQALRDFARTCAQDAAVFRRSGSSDRTASEFARQADLCELYASGLESASGARVSCGE